MIGSSNARRVLWYPFAGLPTPTELGKNSEKPDSEGGADPGETGIPFPPRPATARATPGQEPGGTRFITRRIRRGIPFSGSGIS